MATPPRLTLSLCALSLALAGLSRAGELQNVALNVIAAQAGPPPAQGRPVWATQTARGVNLLPQLPDPSSHYQDDVGSCHAFGSVALLEAAYFRAYGQKVSLSEADLFLRRTVLSPGLYQDFCASGSCKLTEGNDPAGDIAFAIHNGVATGLQYSAFVKRYMKYRKAEEQTIAGVQSEYEQESWLEKLLYDPRKHWTELQQDPQAQRLLSAYLAGRDPKIDAQRAAMRKKFAGFRLLSQNFDSPGAKAKSLSARQALAAGAKQKAAILAELKRNRPVTVSMSLAGLKAWGQQDAKDAANHAFMIIGYRNDPKEGLVFETRNSWGGDNPDVTAADLCRIYAVATIRTPVDK